nr:chalcone isomerase family protein [Ralstonia chuxiongensis]
MPAHRTHAVRALILTLCTLMSVGAWADCRDTVPAPQLSGKGALCLFGFCLYDAQLWSAELPPSYNAPFALEVTYRRALERSRLIETAIDEIRRLQAPVPSDDTLAQWQRAMTPAFPNVRPGDTLCGVYLPGRGARFYANGQLTTEVDDPAFARAFFDIWLAPGTRAPSLRRHLLGKSR